MNFETTQLCEQYSKKVKVAAPIFKNFGGKITFSGLINTVKVHEDCLLVQNVLGKPGEGKVLVVDGGGSLRCALVGKVMAQLATDNGWAGIILDGCIYVAGCTGITSIIGRFIAIKLFLNFSLRNVASVIPSISNCPTLIIHD